MPRVTLPSWCWAPLMYVDVGVVVRAVDDRRGPPPVARRRIPRDRSA
jgi:hypothetical protein